MFDMLAKALFRGRNVYASQASARVKLGVFTLEDRDTPATLYVTSLADDGPGTLRAAVNAVQSSTTGLCDIVIDVQGATALESAITIYNVGSIAAPSGPISYTITRSPLATEYFSLIEVPISIANTTLSISNIAFTDGWAKDGGAIDNGGILTLNNCAFSGNTALYNGGAILNRLRLDCYSTHFGGNTAGESGGAIAQLAGHTLAQVSLKDGEGSYNTAGASGGFVAILAGYRLEMSNVYCISNSALGGFGGVVYCTDYIEISIVGDDVHRTWASNYSAGAGGVLYATNTFSMVFSQHIKGNVSDTYINGIYHASFPGTTVFIDWFKIGDISYSDGFWWPGQP